MSNRFHQLEIGQKFMLVNNDSNTVFTKISKSLANYDGPSAFPINSQTKVLRVGAPELPWQEIEDRHTTDFTERQRDDLIGEIVARAQRQYGADRINADRLTKGLRCAHRAKPIRLIDLLNTCNVDFPEEILSGVYRHYQPETDTMRGGWTARHSEPYEPSLWDILFS